LPGSVAGAVRCIQIRGSGDSTENSKIASARAAFNHCVQVVLGWGVEDYVGRQRGGINPQTLYA
jgi:hypothetical protein